MRKFFTESVQKKELTEMAAPKMPDGVKRKRSADYAHTHDIHIGGQHVATISGHKANNGWGSTRGIPAHVKHYNVHKDEAGMLRNEPHPDHSVDATHHVPHRNEDGSVDYAKPGSTKSYKAPQTYHSMEDAVHAVTNTHKNNDEFGHGHDPKVRWAHAIKLSQGHDDHEKKTAQYASALSHAKALGHDDVTNALQHHADAHASKASKPSQDKLKQWTHDAHHFAETKWESSKHENGVKVTDAHYKPVHPEHHEMAVLAHNVRVHGHPEGSVWDRQRKTADSNLSARGHKGW